MAKWMLPADPTAEVVRHLGGDYYALNHAARTCRALREAVHKVFIMRAKEFSLDHRGDYHLLRERLLARLLIIPRVWIPAGIQLKYPLITQVVPQERGGEILRLEWRGGQHEEKDRAKMRAAMTRLGKGYIQLPTGASSPFPSTRDWVEREAAARLYIVSAVAVASLLLVGVCALEMRRQTLEEIAKVTPADIEKWEIEHTYRSLLGDLKSSFKRQNSASGYNLEPADYWKKLQQKHDRWHYLTETFNQAGYTPEEAFEQIFVHEAFFCRNHPLKPDDGSSAIFGLWAVLSPIPAGLVLFHGKDPWEEMGREKHERLYIIGLAEYPAN